MVEWTGGENPIEKRKKINPECRVYRFGVWLTQKNFQESGGYVSSCGNMSAIPGCSCPSKKRRDHPLATRQKGGLNKDKDSVEVWLST